MFLKKLSLATLACLFASGCIIADADDDGGSETDATASASASASASATETATATATATETATDTVGETGSTTDGTTGDPGAAGCGWGPIAGNKEVPNGYQCGIEDGTVDPDGTHPIDCSPNANLEAGLDCTEAGVTAEGCCDANGDVWFCVDPDGPDGPMEPQVGGDDCGDPTGTDTDATDTDATDTDTDTDATATDTDASDTDADTEGGTDTSTTSGK